MKVIVFLLIIFVIVISSTPVNSLSQEVMIDNATDIISDSDWIVCGLNMEEINPDVTWDEAIEICTELLHDGESTVSYNGKDMMILWANIGDTIHVTPLTKNNNDIGFGVSVN